MDPTELSPRSALVALDQLAAAMDSRLQQQSSRAEIRAIAYRMYYQLQNAIYQFQIGVKRRLLSMQGDFTPVIALLEDRALQVVFPDAEYEMRCLSINALTDSMPGPVAVRELADQIAGRIWDGVALRLRFRNQITSAQLVVKCVEFRLSENVAPVVSAPTTGAPA